MIDREELIERFGDAEFLTFLWNKAYSELPTLRAKTRESIRSEDPPDELIAQFHKLRGLLANFLTEQRAISILVECERAAKRDGNDKLTSLWTEFESALDIEVTNLDEWINEEKA